MPDYQLICEHCLADNELRAEIAERGAAVERCSLCGVEGGMALPCNDDRVKRIFRALIRLNFSEPEYNTHLSGDSLQSLVWASHEIFDLGPDASEDRFEDAFLVLEEDWYPANGSQISLGGGYWDGCVLWGLQEQRDGRVQSLLRSALSKNYFEVEPEARKLINDLRPWVAQTLVAGREFVRGRSGIRTRLKRTDWMTLKQSPEFSYLPFSGKDIGAPPVAKVGAGRLNRAQVSILYLASEAETAVAELRPHPGELVSTGRFRLKQDLLIANLADHDIRSYLSDELLEVFRGILSVAAVMNVPVQAENRHLYAATQLLSDAVRLEGFDGVSFQSSVGNGDNLVCFNPDKFEFIEGSEVVFEVAGLEYHLEKLAVQTADYDKSLFSEDSTDPLSTLVHGMVRRVVRS